MLEQANALNHSPVRAARLSGGMEDYAGSQAQGSVLFSDSADWEQHAGPLDLKMCRPSFIPNHIKMARSGKPMEKLAAARVLTILTSEDAATLDVSKSRMEICSSGGPEALLTMLSSTETTDDTSLTLAKEAAAATIANLCAQDDSRAAVVGKDAIGILLKLIERESSEELLKYACGALGNLARESVENQEAIAPGIPQLINLSRLVGIKPDDDEAAEHASLDDAEADNGLELNASITLRKLAIGNAPNYKMMEEMLTQSELRYFLHGELPNDEGRIPDSEIDK
uniref:Protein HGH1 homolog n=1 Tax=Haptolina brevifila TaxID=156173 RepID=A0A7S2C4S0_9EUKA